MTIKNSLFLFLLLIFFPLFFFGGPDDYSPQSFRLIWNFGHVIFFFLFIYLILQFKGVSRQSFFRQFLMGFVVSFVVGFLIELIQAGISRESDVGDLYRNTLGSMIAVAWFSSRCKSVSSRILFSLRAVLMVLLAIQLFYPLSVLLDEYRAKEDFPVLASFENKTEVDRWSSDGMLTISNEYYYKGAHSLKVALGLTKYSGLTLNHFPRDWRGYNRFVLHLYRPQKSPLEITLRINDRRHRLGDQPYNDRFNQSFLLKYGWNTIEVDLSEVKRAPVGREMDMSEVENFALFVSQQNSREILYLDYVHLR